VLPLPLPQALCPARERAPTMAHRMAAPSEARESGAGAWLALAAVAAAAWLATADLRALLVAVAPTRGLVESFSDFLRTPLLLAGEYPLYEHVRRELAPGTPISVEGDGAHEERRQRFWIALLPDYPISPAAQWAICPAPCAGPGDRVVATGAEFVLVQRGAAPGATQ
jgi:hypothetical protein